MYFRVNDNQWILGANNCADFPYRREAARHQSSSARYDCEVVNRLRLSRTSKTSAPRVKGCPIDKSEDWSWRGCSACFRTLAFSREVSRFWDVEVRRTGSGILAGRLEGRSAFSPPALRPLLRISAKHDQLYGSRYCSAQPRALFLSPFEFLRQAVTKNLQKTSNPTRSILLNCQKENPKKNKGADTIFEKASPRAERKLN